MTSLLDDLNEPQRAAVQHRHGPLMVLAGAGSGKTRVITRRIAHLLETGCPPDGVLAITFTNKAAGEMRERTASLTGRSTPWIATFHGFAARVLRRHLYRIEPYDTSFTICDPDDTKSLVKELLRDLHVDAELWQPRTVLAAISRLKSSGEGDVESLGSDYRSGQVLRSIVLEYTKRMRERNLLDFDDLLLLLVRLFREHPDVLDRYRQQFEFVLIDEYQDTNLLQYTICRLLTSEHRNLCITGDPDQSIYKWRGADIENILRFEKDYPGAHVVLLEQNYRSTKSVLYVANSLISHNEQRKPKELWTENPDGDPVRVARFVDEQQEASHIVRSIQREIEEGRELGEFAVFYRINSLSRTIEQELIYANIPYSIVGGVEFFLRKEIKDVLAYLRILDNPRDSVSLERVINVPARGIGKSTVAKLGAVANDAGRGLLEVVLDSSLREGSLSARATRAVDGFRDLYRALEALRDHSMEELVHEVVRRTGLEAAFEASTDEDARERLENLQELVGAAIEFDRAHAEGGLRGFLELTTLLGDVDRWERRDDRVSLMTIHAAKGLEFPVVWVMGVEEGLIPLVRASSPDTDFEEERRLLYVAITRARQRLSLTHAACRRRFGGVQRAYPSRFLRELQPPDTADGAFARLVMDHGTEESLYAARAGASWSAFEHHGTSPDVDDPFRARSEPDDPIAAEYGGDHEGLAATHGRPVGLRGGRSRRAEPEYDEYSQVADADDDWGVPRGEAEDDYPTGSRVRHATYGVGEILGSSGFGRLKRVRVRFATGEKQLIARFAHLERLS